MSQFKDKGWNDRFELMGDMAERVFQDWAAVNDIAAVEFGLRRPPFAYFKYLPSEIRNTPDFLCEQVGKKPKLAGLRGPNNRFARHFFVEVKGCGRDQVIKIKHTEFETLQKWESFSRRPVLYFAYDHFNRRVSTSLTLLRVESLIEEVPTAYFYDGGPGKPYWAIPTSELEWEPLPTEEMLAA